MYEFKDFLLGKYKNEWDEYYSQNKKLQIRL